MYFIDLMLGEFLTSTHRQELTPQISRWGLQDAGFDYDIVAVFGSQSTGKSRP